MNNGRIQFKGGVELDFEVIGSYQHEILMVIWRAVAATWYNYFGLDLIPVVTSVCDGRHMKNSKHYEGMATDVRSKNLSSEEGEMVCQYLRKILGRDFDVVIETTHIHIEYDPKEKKQ